MEDLIKMVEAGDVFFDIKGKSAIDIYKNFLEVAPLPQGVDKTLVCKALCERELLMSTAVGFGIAIPHSRNLILQNEADERLFIVYPKSQLNMKALDDKKVYVMFILLSSSLKKHLSVLNALSALFRNNDFRSKLEAKPKKEELVALIKAASAKAGS